MHVVKKNVTTKIIAEKLEPPKVPILNPVVHPLKHNTSLLSHPVRPSKNKARKLHRRAYSYTLNENTSPNTVSPINSTNRQMNTGSTRRRRASSAGECSYRGESYEDIKLVSEVPPQGVLPCSQFRRTLDLGRSH